MKPARGHAEELMNEWLQVTGGQVTGEMLLLMASLFDRHCAEALHLTALVPPGMAKPRPFVPTSRDEQALIDAQREDLVRALRIERDGEVAGQQAEVRRLSEARRNGR